MAFLDEIATTIASLSTSWVYGTNVFADGVPDSPDTLIGVYGPAGSPPAHTLGSTAPTFEIPGLQIVSRSTSYTTAQANAQTVYNHLIGQVNVSIGADNTTAIYVSIDASQSPFLLGDDENGRHLVACNYRVRKGQSA